MIRIRESNTCRLYCKHKSDPKEHYLISELAKGKFRRLKINESVAEDIKVLKAKDFNLVISGLLDAARESGSENYYEANT